MKNLTKADVGAAGRSTRAANGADVGSLTRNEAIVHAALGKAGRPMKAYELLDALHESGIRAPMTIYRALDGLQAKGCVQKVLSQNAFACVEHVAETPFRAVVTCRRCGDARFVHLAKHEVETLLGATQTPIADVVIEAVTDCDGVLCPAK